MLGECWAALEMHDPSSKQSSLSLTCLRPSLWFAYLSTLPQTRDSRCDPLWDMYEYTPYMQAHTQEPLHLRSASPSPSSSLEIQSCVSRNTGREREEPPTTTSSCVKARSKAAMNSSLAFSLACGIVGPSTRDRGFPSPSHCGSAKDAVNHGQKKEPHMAKFRLQTVMLSAATVGSWSFYIVHGAEHSGQFSRFDRDRLRARFTPKEGVVVRASVCKP